MENLFINIEFNFKKEEFTLIHNFNKIENLKKVLLNYADVITEKTNNHELWNECENCGQTYDAVAWSRCPNCGQKPIKCIKL